MLPTTGRVRGAWQRMTEKKATEAFTACSSPMGPGSHPRSLGPWEVALDDPVALAPARRHLAVRGTHGPRVPTAFSSVAEPERLGCGADSVQGIRMEGTGPASWVNPSQRPYPDALLAARTSKPGEKQVPSFQALFPSGTADGGLWAVEPGWGSPRPCVQRGLSLQSSA
ncbi:hypothetical protein VULLAG_LOCUS1716 [Vulpes lagopus]